MVELAINCDCRLQAAGCVLRVLGRVRELRDRWDLHVLFCQPRALVNRFWHRGTVARIY